MKKTFVTESFLPPLDDYIKKLRMVWKTSQLTNNGPFSLELCAALKNFLNAPYLSLVNNGTMALQLAIRALKLMGGEIITTPFSYVATSSSIVWEQCVPIFADIDKETWCIDPKEIEKKITKKTKAILATHVFGYPCDVEQIATIARQFNLKIIYDAAHTFGVKYKSIPLCNYGDVATLSFHATKLFHTAEGGAIVCHDKDLLAELDLMKKFGHFGEDNYQMLGTNAKMSELHAAMGICILPYFDQIIAARKKISEYYDRLLSTVEVVRPVCSSDIDYNYSYYPVLFPTSEIMSYARELMHEQGIYPRRYFFPSLNTLPYLYADTGKMESCPTSEDITSRVLALPLSHKLENPQIEHIAELIVRAMEQR